MSLNKTSIDDRPWEEEEFWGWSTSAFQYDEHVILCEYFLIFGLLLCCSIIFQYYVKSIWKLTYFSEAAASMLLGGIISGIVRISGGYDGEYIEDSENFEPRLLGFSSNVFFFGFLPPIIFNSGYHLKRKLFFKNIGAISSLAIIGTLISTFIIAYGMHYLIENKYIKSILDFDFIECVAFGALISSTDPVSTLSVYSSMRVDPTLFYLVFGESVLNDAIAITLFKVSSKFVGYNMKSRDVYIYLINFIICFIGSCIIGYTSGILLALMYKKIKFKYSNITAVSIFVTTVYIPFFLSETLQLSGIVTILCTGIAARRFISKNLNSESRKLASNVFHLMSSISETSCFCLLGLSVFSFSLYEFNWSLIAWVIVLCLLGRAASVYPILFIVNYFNNMKEKIDNNNNNNNNNNNTTNNLDHVSLETIHCVFFSGSRGAVGFACANIFSNKHNNKSLIITTTTIIIILTIFIQGGFTAKFIKYLGIKTNVDPELYITELEKRQKNKNFIDFQRRILYPLVIKQGYKSAQNIINTGDCMDNSSGGGSCIQYNNDSKSEIESINLIDENNNLFISTNKDKLITNNEIKFFPCITKQKNEEINNDKCMNEDGFHSPLFTNSDSDDENENLENTYSNVELTERNLQTLHTLNRANKVWEFGHII